MAASSRGWCGFRLSASSSSRRHLAAVALLARVTPTGFLPSDDQGAFFVVVQLPDGASIGRTSDVVRQVEDILKKETAIADVNSIIGLNFIDNFSQPNAGFLIVTLKDFDERKGKDRNADAIIARLATAASQRAGRNSAFRCAAADHRARHRRRISASCCRMCRAAPPQNMAQVAARPGDRGEPGSAAVARVLDLFRDESVDLPRYRPRQGAHPRDRDQLDIPGAADLARRLLRQRHEPVRADLAGAGAGGKRRPCVGR